MDRRFREAIFIAGIVYTIVMVLAFTTPVPEEPSGCGNVCQGVMRDFEIWRKAN